MVQEGSNTHWTDEEISVLEDNFPKMTNKELSDKFFNGNKFTSRSPMAIKHKGRRVGLSKRDNHRKLKLIEGDYNTNFDDDEFSRFICGFVAGEGSFARNTTKNAAKYNFSISMADVDTQILRDIKEYLGVGNVYEYDSRKEHWADTAEYQVQAIGEIYNVIIPFFDEYGFYSTHKQEQFDEWKWDFLDHHGLTERFK